MIPHMARAAIRRWPHPRWRWLALLYAAMPGATPADAQAILSYFPSGNAGYDQELGVTVLSRARPLYEPPGIRVGSFVVRPNLDQALLYNSNVNGIVGSGSWGTSTAGSVSANSDWARNSLAASVGFDHNQFFSFPHESYTDWNVGIAGGYTIDQSLLSAAYSHQAYYALGNTLGATRTQTPTLDQIDSAQVGYTFKLSTLSITPTASASAYRYGVSTVLGHQLNQRFLDRNVLAVGVDSRYSLSDEGALLVVMRGASSNFVNRQPGQPSDNSNSFQLLAGLDYQAQGPWRYSLLVGMEVRAFQASQFATRVAPIVEGSVTWTPTGLTTLTGTVSRAIEDPQSAGTNGFIATQAGLVVDHELLPNVFLEARGSGEIVEFLQNGGGQQTQLSAGAGASWLVSRNVRLALNYDYTSQTGGSAAATPLNPATLTTAPFRQSVIALTLHLAL